MLYNKVNGNRVININDCLIHKWIKFFNQKTLTYRMDTKIGPIYMLSTKNTLQMQGHLQTECEELEKVITFKWKQKDGAAVFISDKIHFKIKTVTRGK